MLRFLHSSDWQLGAAFGQVPGDKGALLRAERLAAVERIGNRAINLDFWQVDRQALPKGMNGAADFAKQAGVELALWVAPNSSQAHRDWRHFADMLLEFHRTCGIRHFKFDGIMIRTKDAEDNLEHLLHALHNESNGEVIIDFDVTNGQRPGFVLFQEYGIVFLANRYVCHNWGMAYHPELALHKLWQFAQYLRPQRVQIPVTDPDIINYDYYRQQGIDPPDLYEPEYWAAITLFANPLLWLNPSRLNPTIRQTYRRIMDLHRRHRASIFAGEIFPVGAEPDGAAMCGFQSHQFATGNGYLIVYRERRGPAEAKLPLHFSEGKPLRLSSVSDDAADQIVPAATSTATIRLDRPGSFRLYQYEAIKE